MVRVGLDNFDLVKYLVGQVMLNEDDRMNAVREYFPEAQKADWRLVKAGQRVQIIQKDAEKGGVLKLGTEVVTSGDGTISALLGASPGASTAAPIMLDLMSKVFRQQMVSPEWQSKLKAIIPFYGQKLNGNVAATERELAETSRILQLDYAPMNPAANDEPAVVVDSVVGK
jgi:malate dehydrogenase (quinone)